MRIRLCSMTATALSWCIPVHKKLSLREIVLYGMLGALTFSAKLAMAGLYNIEPVSLFVMLFAVTFGKKCVYPIYTYVAMEYLIYGFNLLFGLLPVFRTMRRRPAAILSRTDIN